MIDDEEINKENKYKYLKKSNIGERFYNSTFENFNAYNDQMKKALKISKDYVNNYHIKEEEGSGLIFLGGGNADRVGTGKTHLAIAILIALLEKNEDYFIAYKESFYGKPDIWPIMFCNITNLVSEIRSSYKSESKDSEYEITKRLYTSKLIVIDDLGKEKISDWSLNIIYTIINACYNNLKPIIITTEKNFQQLEDIYDHGIISRIIQMCKPIKMNGEDYRRMKISKINK